MLIAELERKGTWALVGVFWALCLFLFLHFLRLPFVLLAWALEIAVRRVDRAITRQFSRPPPGPVNHFYANTQEGATHRVYA